MHGMDTSGNLVTVLMENMGKASGLHQYNDILVPSSDLYQRQTEYQTHTGGTIHVTAPHSSPPTHSEWIEQHFKDDII